MSLVLSNLVIRGCFCYTCSILNLRLYYFMKDLYFVVSSNLALERLLDFFSHRYLPAISIETLRGIRSSLATNNKGICFPVYLKLSGLVFSCVDSLPEKVEPIVVRTKTKTIVVNGKESSTLHGLDLFPKFRRSEWNSFGTSFRVSSTEDLRHIMLNLSGVLDSMYHIAEESFDQGTEVYISTKEGFCVPSIMTDSGLEPLVTGISSKDIATIKSSEIVNYSKDFIFETPIKEF